MRAKPEGRFESVVIGWQVYLDMHDGDGIEPFQTFVDYKSMKAKLLMHWRDEMFSNVPQLPAALDQGNIRVAAQVINAHMGWHYTWKELRAAHFIQSTINIMKESAK